MWVRVTALLVNFVTSVHSIVTTTSGEERCVTSDDPNNGCEGDYAQY